MVKRIIRKPRGSSQAPGGGAGKQVLIDDAVYISMGVLSADEQEAVTRVLTSPDRVRRLVKNAQRAGSEGKFRVAEITPDLRIVFRETPRQIRLLELFDKQAFESLGIQVSDPEPARANGQRGFVNRAPASP